MACGAAVGGGVSISTASGGPWRHSRVGVIKRKNFVLTQSWRHAGWLFNNSFSPTRRISCSGYGTTMQPMSSDDISFLPFSWPDKQRPRVLILGAGFGGLYTALRLESLLWPDNKKPQVLLVDQSDRFVFKPMLYELLSGEVDVWEVAPLISELIRNTGIQFVKDQVKLVRPNCPRTGVHGKALSNGMVYLENGTVIEYDWLVLALGAETKADTVPGSVEYAFPFSTLEDALRVNKELRSLEGQMFRNSSPIRVAIIGCGYSGVELAATISERLQSRGIVQAINVQTTICPNAPSGNREAALKVLQSRNVKLFLGYFLSSIRRCIDRSDPKNGGIMDVESSYKNKSGRTSLILELQPAQRGLKSQNLEADIVLWTVGSKSIIPELQPLDEPSIIPLNGRGQVETEETLQVRGHPHIFAIGDAASVRDPSGKVLPATAQVAFQQADFAGWNLWAAINNKPLLPFRYQNLGEMMTLGRNDAAITPSFIEGFTLEGPLGHSARKLAYLFRMPTDEHRIKVGMSWFVKTAVDSIASLQSSAVDLLTGSS